MDPVTKWLLALTVWSTVLTAWATFNAVTAIRAMRTVSKACDLMQRVIGRDAEKAEGP